MKKDTAKDLLEAYLYVYNKVMSAPCEVCKFAFHPEKEKINDKFCEENCCYPNLSDFCLISDYFNVEYSNNTWTICTESKKKHIKGCNGEILDYFDTKTIRNAKAQRRQIAKYFWLYTYIIGGLDKHNQFFNYLNNPIPSHSGDNNFADLISSFSEKSQLLCNRHFDKKNIYDKIKEFSELRPSRR